MNRFKNKFSLYIACAANSIVMMAIMFIWLNQFIILDDEVYLIKITTGIKKHLFKLREQPSPNDFLFIDISYEKTLAPEIDRENANKIKGTRPVTDRLRIAEFFNKISEHPDHKFIILDVFLKDSTSYKIDSSLQVAFNKSKNFIIPYHKDGNDKPDLPIFKAPVALSDYEQANGEFVKFKLVQGDTMKTTPLVMYEKLTNETLKDHALLYSLNGKPSLNSFILNLQIWWSQLKVRDITRDTNIASYNYVYLYDLMPEKLPKDYTQEFADLLFNETIKNKIIVVGAFEEGDMHETVYGQTPGPLILLNAYLAIQNKDNLIPLTFILLLFGGFFIISFKCFADVDFLERFLSKAANKGVVHKIISLAGYLLYFVLLSIISYFLFNIHLTVLVLSFYMEGVEYIKGFIEKRRDKKGILDSLIGED
jgi:hypothetical protein